MSALIAVLLLATETARAQALHLPDILPTARSSPLLVTPEQAKHNAFTGSIGYQYPIPVPPGTGNATPSVVLSYSSLTKATEYGWGWTLNLSSIERSTRHGPPTYTSADEFELDGDLLVLDSSSGPNRFHRERTQFEKIEFFPDSNGSGGWWSVTRPDGTQMRYGKRDTEGAKSRLVNPYEQTADNNSLTLDVFRWRLDEVVDPRGNSYRITYEATCNDDDADCTCVANEYCPDSPPAVAHLYPQFIDYSFHESSTVGAKQDTRRVTFLWEPRGDIGEDADRPTNYRGGFQDRISRRLSGIVTRVGTDQAGRWEMTYAPKTTSAAPRNPPFSQLQSIQRYGHDDQAFPTATLFQYSTPDVAPADVAPAVLNVLPTGPGETLCDNRLRDATSIDAFDRQSDVVLMDLNGDGLLDRLGNQFFCSGISGWWAMFGRFPDAANPARFEPATPWLWYDNTGQPSSTVPSDVANYPGFSFGLGSDCGLFSEVQVLDMDGDGLADLVDILHENETGSNKFEAVTDWRFRRGRGDGFGPWESWSPPAHDIPPLPLEVLLQGTGNWPMYGKTLGFYEGPGCNLATATRSRLVDVNGDGRPDHIARTVQGVWSVAINAGCDSGGACGFEAPIPIDWSSSLSPSTDAVGWSDVGVSEWDLADVNGDGLLDQVSAAAGCILTLPSILHAEKFNHLETGECVMDPGQGLLSETADLRDVNGDGWLDRLDHVDGFNTVADSVFLGLGDGTFSTQPVSAAVYKGATALEGGVDLDSDGLFENLNAIGRYHNQWELWTHGLPPGLLTEITNELGGVTVIGYSSTASFSGRVAGAASPEFEAEDLSGTSIGGSGRNYWLVSSVDHDGGRAGTVTQSQTMSYAEPRYDWERRQNHGLRMAEVTADGVTARTIFHQGRSRRGLTQLAEIVVPPAPGCQTGCQDALYQSTDWLWQPANPAPGVLAAFPERETSWLYDPATGSRQGRRWTRQFDLQLGQLSEERDWGTLLPSEEGDEQAVPLSVHTADDVVTSYTYASNETEWLISYPSSRIVTDGGENLLGDTRWGYDNLGLGGPPVPGVPPTSSPDPQQGLTTEVHHLIAESPSPQWAEERMGHTSFGLLEWYHDPERVLAGGVLDTLRFTYESDFNTFPVITKNAVGHDTHYRFDELNGQITKRLDSNQHLECWAFDSHHRLAQLQEHSSATLPTVLDGTACDTTTSTFTYPSVADPSNPPGDPAQQRIETLDHAGNNVTVFSAQYFDGLGRPYKSVEQAENAEYVVTLRGWGSRGEETCTGLPFETSNHGAPDLCENSKPYRVIEYDALLRPTRSTIHMPSSGAAWGSGSFEEMQTTFEVADHDGLPLGAEQSPELITVRTDRGTYPGGTSSPDRTRRTGADARGRAVSVESLAAGGSNLTLIGRDPLGRVTTVNGPDVVRDGGGIHHNLLTIRHDFLGRRISLTEAADEATPSVGPTWTYGWDGNGNLVSELPPRGAAYQVDYAYDALNRLLIKDVAPINQGTGAEDTQYIYDQLTDPESLPNNGWLTAVFGPDVDVDLEYDRRGNLVEKVRTVSGIAYAFGYEYDLLDRRTYAHYPDNVGLEFAYDGGRIASVRNRGLPTEYVGGLAYHADGNLASISYTSNAAQVATSQYTVDPGTLLPAQASVQVNGTSLDGLSYSFDVSGNLRSATTLSGLGLTDYLSESYEYDELHRIQRATATSGAYSGTNYGDAGGIIDYGYDDAGNLTQKGSWSLAYANGAAPAHAVTTLSGGGDQLAYGYDVDGNMETRSGTFGGSSKSDTLTWDAEGRLSQFQAASWIGPAEYKYDDAGLRVLRALPSGMTGSRTYVDSEYEIDASAQTRIKHVFIGGKRVLSVIDDLTADSDGDGTPDRYECEGYTSPDDWYGWNISQAEYDYGIPDRCLCGDFNNDGKLNILDIQLVDDCSTYNPQLYDPTDRHDANGDHVCNVLDTLAISAAMYSSACGTTCGAAGWGPGQADEERRRFCHDASVEPQKELRYHSDQLGSQRLVTDHNGLVVQRTLHRPFGELIAVVNGQDQTVDPPLRPSHYLFTDQHRDYESELDYFGARYYDPVSGRFLSMDPELLEPGGSGIRQTLRHAAGSQAYTYAVNSPKRFVDPDGRSPTAWGVAASVLGELLRASSDRLGPGAGLPGGAIGWPRGAGHPGGAIGWPGRGNPGGTGPLPRSPGLPGSHQGFAPAAAALLCAGPQAAACAIAAAGAAVLVGGGYLAWELGQAAGQILRQQGEDENGDDVSDHAQDSKADPTKNVGDANKVVKEGVRYKDADTGYDVYVKGDKVVIKDGDRQVTEFKNPRQNTNDRIARGKWIPNPR